MSGVNGAHRTPTAAYCTILESRTHGGWPRKNGFWFRSPYQKWVEKEEFKFSGLSGQISNFLTLFLKCAPKSVKRLQNKKKNHNWKCLGFFSVWLQFDKKNRPVKYSESQAMPGGYIPHIVQIGSLGYKDKLQEKSETAMRTPLQWASNRAPTWYT